MELLLIAIPIFLLRNAGPINVYEPVMSFGTWLKQSNGQDGYAGGWGVGE